MTTKAEVLARATPRRCRWFTMSRAGIIARIPFARRIVCVWFEHAAIRV